MIYIRDDAHRFDRRSRVDGGRSSPISSFPRAQFQALHSASNGKSLSPRSNRAANGASARARARVRAIRTTRRWPRRSIACVRAARRARRRVNARAVASSRKGPKSTRRARIGPITARLRESSRGI
eukprot:30294-Pelagococcus_subviridis.AAC.93